MRLALLVFALLLTLPLRAGSTEIRIPGKDIAPIKSADTAEVSGTNAQGIEEDFSVRNAKALSQFVGLITDDRYVAAPKSLNPDFKSRSHYHIRLTSRDSLVFEFDVIGESILDIPGEDSYYMQAERHSDLLMAALRRLR